MATRTRERWDGKACLYYEVTCACGCQIPVHVSPPLLPEMKREGWVKRRGLWWRETCWEDRGKSQVA